MNRVLARNTYFDTDLPFVRLLGFLAGFGALILADREFYMGRALGSTTYSADPYSS